jgi:antitoxin component YwqK of YwqJK toxin-antitoxin module
MKTAALAFCLLVALLAPTRSWGDGEFFRSNALGMLLGPAGSAPDAQDRPDYLLKRFGRPGMETRVLSKAGKETRRWERSLGPGGRVMGQTETVDGQPVSLQNWDQAGNIVEERRFANGKPAERIRYAYDGNRLSKIEYDDQDGKPGRRDEYLYGAAGELREVRRLWPDGRRSASRYATVGGLLLEEYHSQAGADMLVRFDRQGRPAERRDWKEKSLFSSTAYAYDGLTGPLLEERVSLPVSGRRIVRRFDAGGRMIEEETFAAERSLGKVSQKYENGRLAVRRQIGPGGVQESAFSYDADGRLSVETLKDGASILKKTTYLANGERAEELYRQGRLVLRLYIRAERVVREEIIRDGEVIRVRGEED